MTESKNSYILELKKSITNLGNSNNSDKVQYYRGQCEGIMLILLKMKIVDTEELLKMTGGVDVDIPTVYNNINAFDALCELASAESWCWNFPCSTCANMEFRYGFLELAKEKHPYDEDWTITKDDIGSVYAFPYRYPFEYPLKEREAILQICLESNLAIINRTCRFPEWLGYLGLVLRYMDSWKEPSGLYGKLSKYWANQLQEMVPKSSAIYEKLGLVGNEDELRLSFSNLEACEKAMNGDELREIKQREKVRNYYENIAYESLVEIINNPGRPYSSEVAIYARQENVDMLNDEQYKKLCQMYGSLSINANNPWAKFKAKFLNGR